MTVGGRLTQPGTDTAIGNLASRTKALEQASHGHLIYVGTYPTDPNTSPDSPPFQNSWGNIGGNYPPLAFCINANGFVELEGTCSGGVDGTVVFTLPEGYRPDQSQRFVAALSAGSDFCTIQVDPTGDVTLVARGFDPGTGGFAPSKISTSGATAGQVLTDVGGVATWADPSPGTAANVEIEVAGSVIGTRGTLNLTTDGIASVNASDDGINSRVNIQFGVAPGAEGTVLTTVLGVATWQNPSAPPTPPTVYPTIQVGGISIGTEPTINFVEENLLALAGIHNVGTNIEVDIGLVAGANGQVIQTVAGVPTWSDLLVAREIKAEWNGALPASVPTATTVLYVPAIAGVSRTFNLQRVYARVETPGAGPTTIQIQKSAGGGPFVGTDIGDATIAGGAHDVTVTTSLGIVNTGDLVRVMFTAVGAGAASFYVEFEALEQV